MPESQLMLGSIVLTSSARTTFRFQEVYHPESTYLEKPPTAQLTRIDAADRLFSVSLTHITSVPGVCRFVRGIPVGIGRRVAELWGFCGARRSP